MKFIQKIFENKWSVVVVVFVFLITIYILLFSSVLCFLAKRISLLKWQENWLLECQKSIYTYNLIYLKIIYFFIMVVWVFFKKIKHIIYKKQQTINQINKAFASIYLHGIHLNQQYNKHSTKHCLCYKKTRHNCSVL